MLIIADCADDRYALAMMLGYIACKHHL